MYVPAVSPLTKAVVPPVLQVNVLEPVPPTAKALADPFEPPLQLTLVTVVEAVTAVGCVIVTLAVVVHVFASVTVTVYVPAVKADFVAVDPPPVQE